MMLRFILFTLLFTRFAFGGIDPLKTTKANEAKEKAEKAFSEKDYTKAIAHYKYLLDTLHVKDEKVVLNLAHAYMRKADYQNALSVYTEATKAPSAEIRSLAFQQLGILHSERGNKEEALNSFKNAIKHNPKNNEARFNYELLLKNKNKDMPKSQDKEQREKEEKKNEEEKKQEQKKKEDQEQQKKGGSQEDQQEESKKGGENNKGEKEDQKGKEGTKEQQKETDKGKPGSDNDKSGQKGKEGNDQPKEEDQKGKGKEQKPSEEGKEKGEAEKPSEKGEDKKNKESESIVVNKEQLKKMNMTEQQAKALLNSMRQSEVQYIQQMKRTSGKTPEKHKKDW